MIRTARLLLRPAREGDFAALHAMFSDPETMRYWDRPPHDAATTRAFLQGLLAGDGPESIERIVEHEGRVIGRVGMWRMGEIGYIFDRSVWGQGFATEALGALIAEIWRRWPDLARLEAEIDPRNLASARVLEKLGFRLEREEARTLLLDGEWCDSAFYALGRSDPQGG